MENMCRRLPLCQTRLLNSPQKTKVLDSLRALLKKDVRCVYVHYVGLASVSYKKEESGQWQVLNETIKIEEVLSLISEATKGQTKPVRVCMVTDCCGAAGAYYRLCNLLGKERLELN